MDATTIEENPTPDKPAPITEAPNKEVPVKRFQQFKDRFSDVARRQAGLLKEAILLARPGRSLPQEDLVGYKKLGDELEELTVDTELKVRDSAGTENAPPAADRDSHHVNGPLSEPKDGTAILAETAHEATDPQSTLQSPSESSEATEFQTRAANLIQRAEDYKNHLLQPPKESIIYRQALHNEFAESKQLLLNALDDPSSFISVLSLLQRLSGLEFSEATREILLTSPIPILEKAVAENSQNLTAVISTIDSTFTKFGGGLPPDIFDFFVKHLPEAIRINGGLSPDSKAIAFIARQGDPELIRKTFDTIMEQNSSENPLISTEHLRQFGHASPEVLSSLIESLGLNAGEIINLWKWSLANKKGPIFLHGPEVYGRNFQTICELELKYPGSSKKLTEPPHHIADFGRYPLEMLTDQYERLVKKESGEYHEEEGPKGKIYYPRYDHTAVFHGGIEVLRDFYKQFKGLGGQVDIFEISDTNPILKSDQDATIGESSFVIFAGHGHRKSTMFGNNRKGELKKRDFRGKKATKLASTLTENPTIILFSCSTGKPRGIAQAISKRLHARVLAPADPATPTSLDVEENSATGKLEYSISYCPGTSFETGKHTPGIIKTMTYDDGELIEGDEMPKAA